jgi:hypothetical protein
MSWKENNQCNQDNQLNQWFRQESLYWVVFSSKNFNTSDIWTHQLLIPEILSLIPDP